MNLRCFIAIELPHEIKRNIDTYVEQLKATKADVKWVPAKNLHLTLKFLGSTPEELLTEINKKLSSIAKLHDRFTCRIFGAGVFPNIKQPRVIWLGIKDAEEMIKLQKNADESMAELGFKKEDREFNPHLTIGKVRSPKNKDMLIKELATLKGVDFGKIEVKNIVLMKSDLKPSGAEYIKLTEVCLGKE
ncbi:MAG: RNA 2',3'-cyclic phosphodiesterase [Thermodesulfovibrionales bacterium]|nr:RNA 2',3'-cyclic phosphodiesterase [Thermodesulfovibrionales bacterium]